jgi:hypothetical protein
MQREMELKEMSDQSLVLQLEIPPEVMQQDVWNLEAQLGSLPGVTTDLQEPKDLLTPTLLFLSIAGPYVNQAITIAGGMNTLHEFVQTIYAFLHPKKQDAEPLRDKNKVVITTKGKRIELYNLSSEEIEKVIKA